MKKKRILQIIVGVSVAAFILSQGIMQIYPQEVLDPGETYQHSTNGCYYRGFLPDKDGVCVYDVGELASRLSVVLFLVSLFFLFKTKIPAPLNASIFEKGSREEKIQRRIHVTRQILVGGILAIFLSGIIEPALWLFGTILFGTPLFFLTGFIYLIHFRDLGAEKKRMTVLLAMLCLAIIFMLLALSGATPNMI